MTSDNYSNFIAPNTSSITTTSYTSSNFLTYRTFLDPLHLRFPNLLDLIDPTDLVKSSTFSTSPLSAALKEP